MFLLLVFASLTASGCFQADFQTLLSDPERLGEAQAKLEKALTGDLPPDKRAALLAALAGFLLQRGDLGAAEARAEEALRTAPNPELRKLASVMLGLVHFTQGRTSESERALEEASTAANAEVRALALVLLGVLRLDNAVQTAITQLPFPRMQASAAAPHTMYKAIILDYLRHVLRLAAVTEDFRKAKLAVETALAITRLPDTREFASVRLGSMLLVESRMAEASSRFERALRSQGPMMRQEAHYWMALLRFFEGNWRQTVEEVDRALGVLPPGGALGPLDAIKFSQLKAAATGLMSWEEGDSQQAEQAARQLIRATLATELLRSAIDSTEGRKRFRARPDVRTLNELIVSLSIDSVEAGRVPAGASLTFAEYARARMLRERLLDAESVTLPPALAEGERALLRRMAQPSRPLSMGVAVSGLDPSSSRVTAELDAFIAQLQANPDPTVRSYVALRYFSEVSEQDIRRMLRGAEVLVEYKVTLNRTFVWIVRRDRPVHVRTLEMGRVELRMMVERLLNSITQDPSSAFDVGPARALHDLLIGDALSDVENDAPLLIVPDDVLALIPFEVLVVAGGGEAGPTFLGARRPITYSPSAATSILLRDRARRRPAASLPLLAVGDPVTTVLPRTGGGASLMDELRARGYRLLPLPATADEVRAVAQILDTPVSPPHVLLGPQATKRALLRRGPGEELERYRFIHLATHGVLDSPQLPGLSQPALLLAHGPGADEADRYLTAQDIANLKLGAEMVVLSACETGRGEEVPGEGILSLGRAVLHAGAASVVVSLWNVADEATARFMERFYAYLVNGKLDKARALQRVRLDFIASAQGKMAPRAGAAVGGQPPLAPVRSDAHPFFWAPFILIGENALVIPHAAGVGDDTSQGSRPGGTKSSTLITLPWSDWMSGTLFQLTFDSQFREGFYPARLEGTQTIAGGRFRAVFEKLPGGVRFYSYFGLTEDRFAKRDAELVSLGFRLIWTQVFVDAEGRRRFQATWIKG